MNLTTEISNEKWQEVAESTGFGFTGKQIKGSTLPSYILLEIIDGSYTDTDILDQILNQVTTKHIGLNCPTYGDSTEYKQEFDKKLNIFLQEN